MSAIARHSLVGVVSRLELVGRPAQAGMSQSWLVHLATIHHISGHIMHTMHTTPPEKTSPVTLPYYHCVLWLDHHEARMIHFSRKDSEEAVITPLDPPEHLHIKSGSASGTHIREEADFYRDVAKSCDEAQAILLVGPSTAKGEFMSYLKKHSPLTVHRIAGIETLAKVTDPQLLAEGRRYFAEADRMTPHTPAQD